MAYLFGDLTPAPFTTNFLEELRDAIDFSAALADADQCIVTADVRREELRKQAVAERARIDALARAVTAALDAAEIGANDSATAKLSAEIAKATAERRAAAEAAVERKLADDVRALEAETLAARADYFPILERYVLLRDPPTATRTLRVQLVGTKKDERRYVADIDARSELGLDWSIEVSVPTEGPWSAPVRVDDVADGLAIVAPHLSGLIKKEVKRKKTKLGRHFITKVTDDDTTSKLEVREDIGEEEGFDVTADLARRVVVVEKTSNEADPTVGPFDVEPEDLEPLLSLASELRKTVRGFEKKRLVAASFDGLPFDGTNTDAQAKLVELVARIADKLGPLVDEVAVRSRNDDELVLRRTFEDGRREELFMPKSRLREKLAGLDDAHMALFGAIGSALDASSVAEAATIEVEDSAPPPSAVRAEVPPSTPPYPRRESGKMQAVVVPKDRPQRVSVPPPPRAEEEPLLLTTTKAEAKEGAKAEAQEKKEAPAPARNADLIAALKDIRALAKEGNHEEAFRQYATLFSSHAFGTCRPEDQRQALRLMIFGKVPSKPTDEMRAAHRAALPALQALVLEQRNPADYEMLGMTYVALDEPEKATEIFKKALEIERARNPGSDLCGDLMRRVSQL